MDAQEPITTSDSEPEPDVVVVRGERRRYHDRHPGPEDVALVVEIADTTLQRDRTIKKRLYARAGIPRYWIVNLVDRQIEAYAQPRGGDEADYLDQQIYHISDEMPVTLGDGEVMRIAVRDLLP